MLKAHRAVLGRRCTAFDGVGQSELCTLTVVGTLNRKNPAAFIANRRTVVVSVYCCSNARESDARQVYSLRTVDILSICIGFMDSE